MVNRHRVVRSSRFQRTAPTPLVRTGARGPRPSPGTPMDRPRPIHLGASFRAPRVRHGVSPDPFGERDRLIDTSRERELLVFEPTEDEGRFETPRVVIGVGDDRECSSGYSSEPTLQRMSRLWCATRPEVFPIYSPSVLRVRRDTSPRSRFELELIVVRRLGVHTGGGKRPSIGRRPG